MILFTLKSDEIIFVLYLEHWKTRKFHPTRHSREGGNPLVHHRHFRDSWTPAFAGVTMRPVVGNFGF